MKAPWKRDFGIIGKIVLVLVCDDQTHHNDKRDHKYIDYKMPQGRKEMVSEELLCGPHYWVCCERDVWVGGGSRKNENWCERDMTSVKTASLWWQFPVKCHR